MTTAATQGTLMPIPARCAGRRAPGTQNPSNHPPTRQKPARRRFEGIASMPTCARCLATWGGTRPAHCGSCHLTFSGLELFDAHRHHRSEHGGCLPPATIVDSHGERRMFERDGVWRGPEMPELARARVKGQTR